VRAEIDERQVGPVALGDVGPAFPLGVEVVDACTAACAAAHVRSPARPDALLPLQRRRSHPIAASRTPDHVYLREDSLVRLLDDWLVQVLYPDRVETLVEDLSATDHGCLS
jgi:hypothetical protein